MHPAGSLIFFTVLSGLGFGWMAFLGLGYGPETGGWEAFSRLFPAAALAAAGLSGSLLHLGNPRRAWRALSQWRSSWLSREGVFALAALGSFAIFAALWVFAGAKIAPLGALAAAFSALTVLATGMIYAQLKAVPRWRHWSTPALFLALSAAGGALLSGLFALSAGLLALSLAVQLVAWHEGDRAFSRTGSDLGTATGLGSRGRVRLLEGPHTGRSYLTEEMGFRVARRRSRALRRVAVVAGYAVPAALLLWAAQGGPGAVAAPALVLHLIGVAASRWLFYAEAEHVQSLYYGLGANRA